MSVQLFDLKDKIALITGSTRGLGREIGRGLAAAGARLVVNGTRPEGVEACVKELRAEGIDCAGYAFDVTQPQPVIDGIARIEREVGPVEILVNSAGINRRAPLVEQSEEDWAAVIGLDLTALWRVSREVARNMLGRGHGKIINIASLMSFASRPTTGAYSAAKGGVVSLTKAMAVEWAEHGLQANAIAPGYFLTDMTMPLMQTPDFDNWVKLRTPAKRWGDPAELIGAAVFLASEASSFVNGQTLYVDGGWSAKL